MASPSQFYFSILFLAVTSWLAPQSSWAVQDPAPPTETQPVQEKPAAQEESPPPGDAASPANAAPSQEPAPTQENKADELGPNLKKYLESRKEIVKLDNEITSRLSSASLGSSQRYKATMDEIAELRKTRGKKVADMLTLSVDAYLEAPDKYRDVNEDLTRYLRSLLGEQTSTLEYSPEVAIEVAKKVSAASTKNLNVLFYGAHAAFCQNDFVQAKTWLDELQSRGAAVEKRVLENIVQGIEKWDRELKARAADELAVLPQALIKTAGGDVTIELFENEAPNTVANFINLVEKKYYDGTYIFSSQPGRVWMAGCKQGNGSSHAGYVIEDEFSRPEARHHFAGSVVINNAGPKTASAIFSVLEQPSPIMDGKSTVFGRVIAGMDVILKTRRVDPAQIATGLKAPQILSITILRKKSHPYEPATLPLSDSLKSDK